MSGKQSVKASVLQTSSPRNRAGLVMKSSESGDTKIFLRIVSGAMVVGLIASSFFPLSSILRTSGTSSGDALVDSKLHKVPVFTVTDKEGRPFLLESDDHLSRSGYFFIDPHDAEGYLERVKRDTEDAKLLPVGLDEALNYVLKKSGNAKQIPERFTLFPSERELSIAREVTDNLFDETYGENAVPLFYVDGLAFADSSGDVTKAVYPVYFEKETLDKTLSAIRKSNPDGAKDLSEVQVLDLLQTVKEISEGNNPRLERLIFLPLEESMKALQSTTDVSG